MPAVYLAGRNNGVAEEITLQTNEITHKKSDYLEGTYAVHGVEEVMSFEDVVLVFGAVPGGEPEVQDDSGRRRRPDGDRRRVGGNQLSHDPHPKVEGYGSVLQLLAGWNVLVHAGIAMGINLTRRSGLANR